MHFLPSISVIINGAQLKTIGAVSVQNDSAHIGSECDIIVPLNCAIEYVDGKHDYLTSYLVGSPTTLFAVGQTVTITAQYEGYPTINIFSGFVTDFVEGTPMKIKCTDNIFLLNQSTVNLSYKSISIQNLVTNVLQGSGISLILPTMQLQLQNITFRLMSPAAILEWLKRELGINISLQGTNLYMNLASNTVGQVNYDTTRNVIKSDLQTPGAVFLKYKVKAWFINENGTKNSIEVGDKDGHLHEVFFYKVPFNMATYTNLANQALQKVKQHVYSGEIETLLYPDCQLFDLALYNDYRYPARNGQYVITAMHLDLGPGGFHRKVKLSYLTGLNEQAA